MLHVGDKIIKYDGPITREIIQRYADASGDQNPMHINEEFAVKVGLKGVIAHGLLSFGYGSRHVNDIALENNGELLKYGCEMRGMVRPGDTIITEIEVKKIEGKRVEFDITQNSKMPLKIEKDRVRTKTFEGEERGWVPEKELPGVKTEETPEGIFTYREWLVNKGWATIRLK